MIKVTVLYGQPTDPEAFEKYYSEVHMPIAAKVPQVAKLELTKFFGTPDGSTPEFYRMAEIYYASEADMQASLGSDEGKTAVGDIPNFATGGAKVLIGQVEG